VRILHVLSQVEVTGAETYVATLVAEQAKAGHEVIAVSDTLATAMPAAPASARASASTAGRSSRW